ADVSTEKRRVGVAKVEARQLDRPLGHAPLREVETLESEMSGEDVQIDVVESDRAPRELGRLIDGDPSDDFRERGENGGAHHDERQKDCGEDLERAAGQAEHHTSTTNVQPERW